MVVDMESFNNTKRSSLLNEAQERSLLVALQLLEEELFMIQLLTDYGKYEGKLYTLQIDMDGKQCQALKQQIKIILSQIQELQKRFGLKVRTKKLSRRLESTESYFWSILRDQKSQKLKRYGAISNELTDILDPALDMIIEGLQKMAAVIKKDR